MTHRRYLALTLVLALLILVNSPALTTAQGTVTTPGAAPSPGGAMFRGNAGRTGEQPGPGPAGMPMLRWRFQPGVEGFFDPAATAGGVYVIGNIAVQPGDDIGTAGLWLFALDGATGHERWRFHIGQGGDSVPAVVAGVVYASGDSILYAIDAATGTERWHTATQGAAGSPAVVDGVVYVATLDDSLEAIDAATGQHRWRVTISGLKGDPAVVDGAVYAVASKAVGGSEGGTGHHDFVVAVAAAHGKESWRVEIIGGVESIPAVSGGAVYVAQRYGGLLALDATSGARRWGFLPGSDTHFVMTNLAVAGGTVYARGFKRGLFAVDSATGRERWHAAVSGVVDPVVAGDAVYAGGPDGSLLAIDASSGTQRWRFEVGASMGAPAVAAGMIYLSVGATARGHDDSAVVAIAGTGADHTVASVS